MLRGALRKRLRLTLKKTTITEDHEVVICEFPFRVSLAFVGKNPAI
jgi:hypothetical protein